MVSNINELPLEILFLILSLLDLKTLLRAKNVCRFWNNSVNGMLKSYSELMVEDFTYRRLNERCGNFNLVGLQSRKKIKTVSLVSWTNYHYRKRNQFLSYLVPKFTNLRVLYLCLLNGPESQFNLLDMVTETCDTDLRHLSLIARKKVYLAYHEVHRFCAKFKNLKVFQFEATELKVRAMTITFLLESLAKLEIFVVMDSIHSYERHLKLYEPLPQYTKCFFANVSPSIRVIKVSNDLMNIDSLRAIDEQRVRQVSNLHICDFASTDQVRLIADKFKSLQSLTISNSFGFETKSQGLYLMERIGELTQLKKLHLFIESEHCLLDSKSIEQLGKCRELKTLQLESTSLNKECIYAITQFLPQLTKLDLTYIQFEDNSSESIYWIKRLTNLRCLKLSASPELADSSTLPIIQSCNRLTSMDFSRSEFLCDLTFDACIQLAAKQLSSQRITAYFSIRNKFSILSIVDDKTFPENLVLKFPTVKYI